MNVLSAQQLQLAKLLEAAILETSPLDRVQALDAAKTFDADLHHAIAKAGWLGLNVPQSDGGSGGDSIDQLVILRALAKHATSIAVFCVVQFLACRVLRDTANAEQRQGYLHPLAKGDKKAAFCLTEAEGGTDILRCMRTVARQDGDDYVIDGAKKWISGALHADFHIVLARTAPGRTDGISAFIVPADTRGVTVRRIETFAVNSYETCEMIFNGVRVPRQLLLGDEGKGFRPVMSSLNAERLNCSAVALGMAFGAMDTAADYARQRGAFGKTLSEMQVVQYKLADVATAVDLAWSYLIDTARREGDGTAIDIASAMCKLSASNAAKMATDVGMEIMGAAGFDIQSPMQRYYRDHRLYTIAPVNDEMCRALIAERYFGFRRAF